MSLMLPRLIDALEGRTKRVRFAPLPYTAEDVLLFLRAAKEAEVFSFGELPLEHNMDVIIEGRPIWKMPELTAVESEAWDQGLIPLPAPMCWYEFSLGGQMSGILVTGKTGDILIQRVDYDEKHGGNVFSGLWASRDKTAELTYKVSGSTTPAPVEV